MFQEPIYLLLRKYFLSKGVIRMKHLIRKCLITSSLIFIIVFLARGLKTNEWSYFKFMIQVLSTTFVIHIAQTLSNKFQAYYPIVEMAVEFALFLSIVLVFGWVYNWYHLPNIFSICIYVLLVYVCAYLLDMVRVKKDVDFINAQLRLRKEKESSFSKD